MNYTEWGDTLSATGECISTHTGLAIAGAVLTFLSEALPFVKRVKGGGIVDAVWWYVCDSGCMAKRVNDEEEVEVVETL